MPKVWIDAGHGGNDSGAVGNGLEEDALNLSIAQAAEAALRRSGVTVLSTRERDVFATLAARYNGANAVDVDAFVAVHNDWAERVSAQGSSAIYYPGSSQGKRLADLLEAEIAAVTPWPDRGTYADRRGLAVLKHTGMPSAVVECGYVTNPAEAARLRDPAYRAALGEAIARGVCRWLGVTYRPPSALSGHNVAILIVSRVEYAEEIVGPGTAVARRGMTHDEQPAPDASLFDPKKVPAAVALAAGALK